MSGNQTVASTAPFSRTSARTGARLKYRTLVERVLAGIGAGIGLIGIIFGCLSLTWSTLEAYTMAILIAGVISSLLLFAYLRLFNGFWDWKLLATVVLAGIAVAVLAMLPPYFFFVKDGEIFINSIIQRSFVSAVLLLSVSLPMVCFDLFYLFGARPHARDLANYPLILLPVAVMLVLFGIVIYNVVHQGVSSFDWEIITSQYMNHTAAGVVWEDDWPLTVQYSVKQLGMSQFILGTILLVGMVAGIALPIGMGVGLFVTEFAKGRFGDIIRGSATVLRAMSVFILGLMALNMHRYSADTFLSPFLKGNYVNEAGVAGTTGGSFLTAAIVISMLVIPVIARSTEEGIRSLPKDITEGSLAIGASRNYTLFHINIPWSLPNVVTGLLLGCAEAAGSLATVMFISTTSEYGLGPFAPVTTLTYFVFQSMYRKLGMMEYQYLAAFILLLITLGLSFTAIYLKRHFSKRYRGV